MSMHALTQINVLLFWTVQLRRTAPDRKHHLMLVKQFPNTVEMIESSTPRKKKNEVFYFNLKFGELDSMCIRLIYVLRPWVLKSAE
jgi:hypothetical protein